MPRVVMLVHTNPVDASREDDYNTWYNDTHIPDVLKVDGFVAATRYRVSGTQMLPGDPPQHRYLAIYEVETDDLDSAVAGLAGAAGGGMFISDALETDPFPSVVLLEEVCARQSK